jgi:hypothetical protein
MLSPFGVQQDEIDFQDNMRKPSGVLKTSREIKRTGRAVVSLGRIQSVIAAIQFMQFGLAWLRSLSFSGTLSMVESAWNSMSLQAVFSTTVSVAVVAKSFHNILCVLSGTVGRPESV